MDGVVFVDLDSTLADTTQRHHLIDEDWAKTDWDAYALACANDIPFEGPCTLVRMLFRSYHVVIVTGRSDIAMQPTLLWLYQNRVPFNEVIMRPAGDTTPNETFKVSTIRRWLDTNPYDFDRPSLIVDDWPASFARLTAEGWPVLVVNPMYDKQGV